MDSFFTTTFINYIQTRPNHSLVIPSSNGRVVFSTSSPNDSPPLSYPERDGVIDLTDGPPINIPVHTNPRGDIVLDLSNEDNVDLTLDTSIDLTENNNNIKNNNINNNNINNNNINNNNINNINNNNLNNDLGSLSNYNYNLINNNVNNNNNNNNNVIITSTTPVTKATRSNIVPLVQKKSKVENGVEIVQSPSDERPSKFRKKPTRVFSNNLQKAQNEKIQLLLQRKTAQKRTFKLIGASGNIYTVEISKKSSCDCKENKQNGAINFCKHIIFVFIKILSVSSQDSILYQRALTESELQKVFENSPSSIPQEIMADPIVVEKYHEIVGGQKIKLQSQKPITDTDCAICMCPMEEKEELVYCKYSCGQSIHKTCFDEWMKTKKSPEEVQCVYCRSRWDIETIKKSAYMKDGYVNLSAIVESAAHNPQNFLHQIGNVDNLIPFLSSFFRVHHYLTHHDDDDDSSDDSWD